MSEQFEFVNGRSFEKKLRSRTSPPPPEIFNPFLLRYVFIFQCIVFHKNVHKTCLGQPFNHIFVKDIMMFQTILVIARLCLL